MSRYRATLEDIAAQHDKWELTDEPPETRHHEADCVGNFSWDKIPLRSHSKAQRPVCNADMQPRGDNLRELEAFLLHVFLRRYATWRVRTRRYAQAQGAAILAREFRV